MLSVHERQLYTIIENLKRKVPPTFNIRDVEKRIKNTSGFFKKAAGSTLDVGLMKQHARAEFLAFAYLACADPKELTDLSNYTQSSLFYVYQNIKAFMELVSPGKGPIGDKRTFVR